MLPLTISVAAEGLQRGRRGGLFCREILRLKCFFRLKVKYLRTEVCVLSHGKVLSVWFQRKAFSRRLGENSAAFGSESGEVALADLPWVQL